MGGQVAYSFQNLNAVIGHIRGGKMKALAVTSQKRSPLLPDVPTMEEAGVKNVVVNSWQAMAAPKGIPADVRSKLRDGVVEAMADPTVKSNLLGVGFEIVGNTPEQFEKFQAEELARWKKVIESAGIQPS
jgi:tripartite-type tricarboxylate transporter receptor subunit TctC